MRALVENFRDFLKSTCLPNARVAVIHHTDTDGICSGVLAAKIVERFRKKPVEFATGIDWHTIPDSVIALLKKKRISRVIITDLSADESPKQLAKLAKFARILLIDHHTLHIRGMKNLTIIKPQLFSSVQSSAYCASKLCYDFGREVVYLSDLSWIASMGIIGDAGYSTWREFVNHSLQKLGFNPRKDIWRSELGKAASSISAAMSYNKKNIKLCGRVVSQAESPIQISAKLEQFANKIRRTIAFNLYKLGKIKPVGEIIFYNVVSKYDVKGSVATMASFKKPHKTLILYRQTGNMIDISARRQDRKVAVNTLLENVTKGLKNATAGGHIPAAGASIRARDWEKFRQRIIEYAQKAVN